MNKIIPLPLEVYEKIKAGEVIEDTASVIRELLDNAIDSGATQILIEIEEGGLGKILVEDNGSGMSEEDLLICYKQHTTSKIKNYDDIFQLATVGFRGEALASIARVSILKITSSDNDSGAGNYVYIEGGNFIKNGLESQLKGSSVEVKNLFYNVPVRRNFINSPVKETKKIKNEILTKALSYPEISFTFKANKNTVLDFPSKPWEERIDDVLSDQRDNFIPFYNRTPDVSIKGVITNLYTTFSSTENLYFFINNKFVKSRFLYGVINGVFASLIPNKRYPAGVIYIFTNPKNIDPNIHPSKKEIKVFNEDIIYRQLYATLKKLFYPQDENKNFKQSQNLETKSHTINGEQKTTSAIKNDKDMELDFAQKKEDNIIDYKYIGIVFNTYLVFEREEDLFFIDFHAAHERKRYEELKEKYAKIETQVLLTSRIMNLSNNDILKISEKRNLVEKLGFSFYLFGEDAIVINGIPSFYQDKNWEEDFKDILANLDNNNLSLSDFKDKLLKTIACRGSMMSGEYLNTNEAHYLIQHILQKKIPLTCPHGRPYLYQISKKQLANHFLRGS